MIQLIQKAGYGKLSKDKTNIVFTSPIVVLRDDLKFIFREKQGLFTKKSKDLMHFWINVNFVDNYLCLKKEEIDRPHKDVKCKVFSKDFKIELFFKPVDLDLKKDEPKRNYNSIPEPPSPDLSSRDSDEYSEPDASLVNEIHEEYEQQKQKNVQ